MLYICTGTTYSLKASAHFLSSASACIRGECPWSRWATSSLANIFFFYCCIVFHFHIVIAEGLALASAVTSHLLLGPWHVLLQLYCILPTIRGVVKHHSRFRGLSAIGGSLVTCKLKAAILLLPLTIQPNASSENLDLPAERI